MTYHDNLTLRNPRTSLLLHPLLGIQFPESSQGFNSMVLLNKKRLRINML
jgi:hypothetical protein